MHRDVFLMLLLFIHLCYFFSFSIAQQTVHLETSIQPWQSAESFCNQRGGHLASIHNAFIDNFLNGLALNANCPFFYVGGNCNQGKCTWTDGTPFTYSNWMGGQPDSKEKDVSVVTNTGMWQTVSGSTGGCFVCQSSVPMTDCLDWRKTGFTDDGVYAISGGGSLPTNVYCDMTTEGGGWTLFQQRVDGSESFWDRKWTDYKNGFGTPEKNYWMGNELLHTMTIKDTSVTMRIDMWKDGTPGSLLAGDYWWNDYDTFQVGPETDSYRLKLSIDWQNPKGNASDGWYDITYSSGAPFSTVDRINDPRPDCITKYQMGGWWLYNCALATLNGAYTPIDWSTGYGIFFILNGGDVVIHPRQTTMKFRAVK